MEESQLDDVIERLLEVRQSRPGKQVQLTEQEIRHLCLTAKEIFMSQPNLLELEAPIKICGAFAAPPGGLQQRGGSRPGLSLRPDSPRPRRYPWAVLRPAAAVRVRGLPAGGELPVPGGLR